MGYAGFQNIKAALPLNDAYAQHCIRAFDDPTIAIDFGRLLRDSREVDFSDEAEKANHIVIRISCVFLDIRQQKVARFWRGETGHTQNASVPSVLVSSGLTSVYAAARVGNRLVVNRHHPFTEKMGAYLGAFEIDPQWWTACLRRQPDSRTGKMRYYAFFVHRATLKEGIDLPSEFALLGKASNDSFRGFWEYPEALRDLPGDRLAVDALVASRLAGISYSNRDIVAQHQPPPQPGERWRSRT